MHKTSYRCGIRCVDSVHAVVFGIHGRERRVLTLSEALVLLRRRGVVVFICG